nr:MAG TPA: hypothetical protein [Caudoviricetes sp.]
MVWQAFDYNLLKEVAHPFVICYNMDAHMICVCNYRKKLLIVTLFVSAARCGHLCLW